MFVVNDNVDSVSVCLKKNCYFSGFIQKKQFSTIQLKLTVFFGI